MRSRKTTSVLTFLEWARMTHYRDRPLRVLVVSPPRVMGVWEEWKGRYRVGDDMEVVSSGGLSTGKLPHPPNICVIDEVHNYRHYSNRFKALRRITKDCEFMCGLTGTPIDSDTAEFFYYLTLLSKGRVFGTWSKTRFLQVCGYQINPNLTHSPWKLKPDFEREFMEDMKAYIDVYDGKDKITPPECEKAAYDITWEQTDWAQRIVGETPITETVTVKGVETPMMELQAEMPPHARKDKRRQIESGFLLHDGEVVKRFGTNKWGRLQLLLTHCEGQVLVWYRYIEEKREILEITGKKAEFTPKNFEAFKRGESRFMVAHPRAAGAGLDFSCADTAIFVTPNPSNVDVQQALYRLCTVSGSKNKKVYFMVAASPGGREDYRRMTEKFRVTEQLYMKGRA